ncbi:MAG: hypothetical protein N2115_02380 [bacterium]|nr:hypothetical protein [bacterium]
MEDDKTKLHAIYPFFIGPKYHPEFTSGQAIKSVKLDGLVNGEKRLLVSST